MYGMYVCVLVQYARICVFGNEQMKEFLYAKRKCCYVVYRIDLRRLPFSCLMLLTILLFFADGWCWCCALFTIQKLSQREFEFSFYCFMLYSMCTLSSEQSRFILHVLCFCIFSFQSNLYVHMYIDFNSALCKDPPIMQSGPKNIKQNNIQLKWTTTSNNKNNDITSYISNYSNEFLHRKTKTCKCLQWPKANSVWKPRERKLHVSFSCAYDINIEHWVNGILQAWSQFTVEW